jgi:isopenicillin N synthase-like dioxygenase
MRFRTLSLAKRFADLPDEIKAKFEHPASYYSFGWSHGKEKMKKGVPDTKKGSYYFNPEYDYPYGEWGATNFPLLCHPNIWPNEYIPGFASNVMELSKLGMSIAKSALGHCDRYVHSIYPQYAPDTLTKMSGECRVNKGRLLHYFPISEAKPDADECDEWCGLHNDHGFLTVLIPAIYLDKDFDLAKCPDPDCGLYVRSRSGAFVKIVMPGNAVAIQIGESSTIMSGGLLQATPHFVRAPKTKKAIGISRETMAIFLSAKWDAVMSPPIGCSTDQIFHGSSNLPAGVPTLESRWFPGMTFEEFSQRTFASYY